LKQEIQPDLDHIMSLFDQMKVNFTKEINARKMQGGRSGFDLDSSNSID